MFSLTPIFLLSLTPLAFSLPSPTPSPFQVTNLVISEPSGRPGNTNMYTVSFTVSDPSDSSSTTCSVSWPYADASTGYPSNYLACTDANYAFKFVEYNRYYDFKLDVKHVVKKPAPKRTLFARGAVVDRGNVYCVHAASGFSQCTQTGEFALKVYDVKKG